MDNIGKRLEQDLKTALSRRRQLGRAVDKLPGPIGDNSPFANKADQTGLTAANGAAGTTIPVVENFEDGRVLTSMFLRQVGFKIKEAPTAMETPALAAERPELVTDRKLVKRAEPKAETLRWVVTLAAAVSHEINNPLMAVMGNLELLEKMHRLDAHGRARLEVALAAADQIKEKVRRLGRITRLELATSGPGLPPMLDLEKSSQGLDDER